MGRQRDLYGNDATKVLSRRSILDKEKAITTAKNPSSSKFGNVLLTNNVLEGRVLSAEMSRLEREHKRRQMHIEQTKKQFLQQQLQVPEPMLIVQRPPSPEVIRKFLYSSISEEAPYTHNIDEPSYMNGLKSRAKTPSLLPTIDAFTIKVRKKRNIWEEAMLERDKPSFTSTVQPCWPLTEVEQADLRRGWQVHASLSSTNPKTRTHKQHKAAKPLAIQDKQTADTCQERKTLFKPREPPDASVNNPAFITEVQNDPDDITTGDNAVESADPELKNGKRVNFKQPQTKPETGHKGKAADPQPTTIHKPDHNDSIIATRPTSGQVQETKCRGTKKKSTTPKSITQTRTTLLRANSTASKVISESESRVHSKRNQKSTKDLGALREIMKYT